MKILSATQTKELDAYTIKNEPIDSIDLMERACLTFIDWFIDKFPNINKTILIFCGIGNNGGDGLAIARLLAQRFYTVKVFWCKIGPNISPDCQTNFERLPKWEALSVLDILEGDPLPEFAGDGIIIDAIFGSGLSRAVEGYWADLIHQINASSYPIVSVDLPSGLFADQVTTGTRIHADFTFSFELPKLAFLFPENASSVGHWQVETIDLDANFIQSVKTDNHYLDYEFAQALLKKREKFDHKGTYGHALLIAGSYGKIGAAVLAANACLRVGAGLVSLHSPKCGYNILQISTPEVMVSVDPHPAYFTQFPDLKPYKAIGIGPGLDRKAGTRQALIKLLKDVAFPIVLDADALNILSECPEEMVNIPQNSIITPHPKEFERLFGRCENNFSRNQLQRSKAKELGIFIILKGAHTCIAGPDGQCYFNSTGNPGMATAGSGDVLTGIITGLLAQNYEPQKAALLGVYLHGLSGDIAVAETGYEALIASDLYKALGKAFSQLRTLQ